MVEIADIKDEESLRVWLEALPGDKDARKQIAVALAHRAAMRVLPLAWREYEFADWARDRDLTVLPFLRANHTCGVVGTCPTPQIAPAASAAAASAAIVINSLFTPRFAPSTAAATGTAAASAAAAAARAAADIAVTRTAADAAADAGVIVSNAWSSLRQDCALIQEGDDPMQVPLWHDAPNSLEREWRDLRQKLEASDDAPHWAFWISWYDRALKGEPQDWAGLLTDVALIEDEVWEKGLEAVSARISALSRAQPRDRQGEFAGGVVKQALARNAPAIRPQTEALSQLLDQELERLRGRNPRDDIEQQEIERLRAVFSQIKGHVVALGVSVAEEPSITEEAVDEVKNLYDLYRDEALKWPRENAADIVDSAWRVMFIGATAGLFVTCGAPLLAGLTTGGVLFGGKKLAGLAKAVKDGAN